jgi:hypothetical protein
MRGGILRELFAFKVSVVVRKSKSCVLQGRAHSSQKAIV